MIDLTVLEDSDLETLRVGVLTEQSRRQALAEAPRMIEQAQILYLDARAGTLPDERIQPSDWPDWQQPTGAHDAYPSGYVVHDGGRLWRSARADNAPASHQPGTEHGVEWTDVTVELLPDLAPEPDDWPAWSATATYTVGDRVTHNGKRWECLLAHGPERQGTWAPGPATPTIWEDLGAA